MLPQNPTWSKSLTTQQFMGLQLVFVRLVSLWHTSFWIQQITVTTVRQTLFYHQIQESSKSTKTQLMLSMSRLNLLYLRYLKTRILSQWVLHVEPSKHLLPLRLTLWALMLLLFQRISRTWCLWSKWKNSLWTRSVLAWHNGPLSFHLLKQSWMMDKIFLTVTTSKRD